MKVPTSLAKTLSPSALKTLESELKNSILAKQLRKVLKEKIEQSYIEEESMEYTSGAIAQHAFVRRGIRAVLKLLPEEEK